MGVRRLFLTVALTTVLVPGPAVRADLNYRAEITGAEDSDLADLLDKISELKTLEDKPPASEEALRRRADRDLGRLADAAHSLGYWDAEFSYEVDTQAEPAKVTVKVEPGPLYHVASVTVQGPDGHPLAIPNVPKLPLKLGDPARTAPVVATETALVAALGDSGHPFAKVEDRRVELDKTAQTMEVTYTLDPGPVERFGPLAITGLERLDPGYVEGRIRWQRSAVYDEAKVEEARRALIASGLFSTVRITPLADADNPGDVRMTVDVTERLHRSIGVGLAYNTSQGFGARAFWENRNLFGNAENLRLSAEVGQQIDAFRANSLTSGAPRPPPSGLPSAPMSTVCSARASIPSKRCAPVSAYCGWPAPTVRNGSNSPANARLAAGVASSRYVERLLKADRRQPFLDAHAEDGLGEHGNLRGPAYYN